MRHKKPDTQSIAERRLRCRFPLGLDVRYDIPNSKVGHLGSGRTLDLSSSGIKFTTNTRLRIGQRLRMALDWPALLDGTAHLQLSLLGKVVRIEGNMVVLKIEQHEFRTRHA